MKQLVKTSLIFLLLFSFQNLGFGQGSFVLKGQIMDGAYKEPLMAAAVSIKGKASGTATDLDGKFEFEIAKKYWNDTLVISMLGYTAQKMTVREAMVLPNHYFETTLEETSFNLEMAEIGAPIILNMLANAPKQQQIVFQTPIHVMTAGAPPPSPRLSRWRID